MATWYKTTSFKYLKNLVIGVGASLVMIGALFKIESLPNSSLFLTIGLVTEAILFLVLGLLPPDKDYYWEKLYPGIEDYHSDVPAILPGVGAVDGKKVSRQLNAEAVENSLSGMLNELQGMSRSMSSLKALQEVDFSQTKQQMKSVGDFYSKMNEAFLALNGSVEDAKKTQQELGVLSKNLTAMNGTYTKVNEAFVALQGSAEDARKTQQELALMSKSLGTLNNTYVKMGETFTSLQASADDAKKTQEQLNVLAKNLSSMNRVYGNVLSAMNVKEH
ncbi:MAG TPA: gliding motility protein GldL [Saprospiraceae bacterium]|nr:gliding motility protein GldL [Saprospiraceae bacterium]HNT21737.1 gliding motility protein GldL [Saprospiraceae bacterium]